MKKRTKTIKELAKYFDEELQSSLPITILPNGALGYKNFLVKQLPNSNWGVFNVGNTDLVNQYYLKSCALMAAKFYNHKQVVKCYEVKDLDDGYWSNYSDSIIFKNNLVKVNDDKYQILLTRLEESSYQAKLYQNKISVLFKWTFV
jgi:hypothetical protein